MWVTAQPDEYLAITGAGIKTLKIVKAAWVFPFQKVCPLSWPEIIRNLTIFSVGASVFSLMITGMLLL